MKSVIDLVIRIKNGYMAGNETVLVPANNTILEVLKKLVVLREDEAEGLEPLPHELQSVTRRRKGGRRVMYFSNWIRHEPLEKWAFIADIDDSCFGIMTINLVEVYN